MSPVLLLINYLALMGVLLIVIAPLAGWLTVSIPKAYEYEPTRDDELSAAAKAFLGPVVRALCDEGFEVVANLRPTNAGVGVTAVTVCFVRRETGDMATVTRASNVAGQNGQIIAFDTQFADGSIIVTLNQTGPGIFPVAPYERRFIIPRVRDPHTLYQIHRCRVQAYAPAGVPLDVPEPGTEVDRLHREHARQIEWLIAAGYFKPTTGRRHRATLKGATIMIWRLTIPIKWLIIWHQRRRAHAELRTLGFNAFTPVVAAAQP
jgi:hypothetical protein